LKAGDIDLAVWVREKIKNDEKAVRMSDEDSWHRRYKAFKKLNI